MRRTNPYQSTAGDDVRSSSPSGRPTTGSQPQATARIVRGLEYVVAFLVVMQLIWVVHTFGLSGDLLP